METENKTQSEIDKTIKRRNFISFSVFFGLGGVAYGGWNWLTHSAKETRTATGGARVPLRRALNKTELAFRRIFSRNNPVKTYPKSAAAKTVRQNGNLGLNNLDTSKWQLQVKKQNGEILKINLNEIKKLPKTDIIFDFKCVEGWDQIQHWGGVKFTDFVSHYQLENEAKMSYIGIETPDNKYYVGLDIDSAMHSQTILAYEMNGEQLTIPHGAPLRLIVPVKYGIKNLKQIGNISFSNTRPRDYWAERGYDYYSGL